VKSSLKPVVSGWLLLFLALSLSPALAQENKHEEDYIRQETAARKTVAATAERAEQQKSFETVRKITFEDILQDPDNAELNFQYAQQQVAENDLLGAVGTLERILAVRPELHEVRLFYAVVLFRLDNLPEAERELNQLEKAPLSGQLRQEWENYRHAIKLRKKKTRFALTQSNGYEIDTNRNAAPSSKQLLFANTLINNAFENRRRRDNSFLNITNLDVVHDLGFQAGHELIGSFTYYLQDQSEVESLDLGSFQYDLGGTYKSRYFNFTPTFTASHVFLSDENYLRTQGGNFLFTRTFFDKLESFINYRIEHQDYLRIKENDAADERTGWENGISAGAAYAITPTMRVSGSLLYSYKNAARDYEGYDRFGFRLAHSWLLGKGQFLINSADTSFDRYDEQDAAIATQFRKDTNFRYRVTYGAPLTFFLIGKILPKPFKNIVASFTYEYFRSLSNITNYTYTNHKFQGLLTKKWEF
jgi:hypothetical protein